MCQLKISADIHLGGGGVRVIKMTVICQRVVIFVIMCAYKINNTLTFHLIPNLVI